MIGTIAPTDHGWYEFLRHRGLDEVNFWKPSGRRAFRAEPFSPFLFKLKAPYNAICGFGLFATWTRLPDWFAWECFGIGNGCESLQAMEDRIARLRAGMHYVSDGGPDTVGCILLVGPVFFESDDWIPQPVDWPVRSLTPVGYDLETGEGRRVWQACVERAAEGRLASHRGVAAPFLARDAGPRFGQAHLVSPRLGQGTFRVLVTDAYNRACAVTGEHSLPVLEAAHIKPYSSAGPHLVSNGLLLRSDVHRLFDQGYVTVTPEHRIKVSDRLRMDYQNGRTYYPFDGKQVGLPAVADARPSADFLLWHNRNVFRA
jgi:putative restriction endonuclease